MTQAFQGTLAAALLLGRGQGWRQWRCERGRRWAQPHAADLEVFFEAIGLQEIGELEGADIAALGADFALQVSEDRAQVLQRVADAQKLIPHSFPVKGQAQRLAGELTVEPVGLLDGRSVHGHATVW